jgi:hypothetical protein
LVPPVATGKKFVVTYVATVLNTNNSAFPLVTGRCGIIVVNPQAVLNPIVAAVPLDADLNGSLQLFLPLNAGESLELTCSGLAANSVRPPQSFRGVVGGYSVPAS